MDEILEVMKQRQQLLKRESQEYKEIEQKIKIKCRLPKEEWLSAKFEEIEQNKDKDCVAIVVSDCSTHLP